MLIPDDKDSPFNCSILRKGLFVKSKTIRFCLQGINGAEASLRPEAVGREKRGGWHRKYSLIK